MQDARGKVGRYEILRVVGRGGMATVYLARQLELDRLVALKGLTEVRVDDHALAERLLRESKLASKLNHERIVTVHEFFQVGGTPYISMEYLEGGSLRPRIGRLSLEQNLAVVEDLLDGLGCAERHGIVHRDLKPENVLIAEGGRVKIADFGIAKAINEMATATQLTAPGTTLGTPTYMAPEQAMGRPVDSAADRYALGVIAYELLAGHPPFRALEPVARLFQHVSDPIPPLREANPGVHPRLAAWVEQLLAKDPGERLGSAEGAWAALEDGLGEILGDRADPRRRGRAGLILAEPREEDSPRTPTASPPQVPETPAPARSDEYNTYHDPEDPRRVIDAPDAAPTPALPVAEVPDVLVFLPALGPEAAPAPTVSPQAQTTQPPRRRRASRPKAASGGAPAAEPAAAGPSAHGRRPAPWVLLAALGLAVLGGLSAVALVLLGGDDAPGSPPPFTQVGVSPRSLAMGPDAVWVADPTQPEAWWLSADSDPPRTHRIRLRDNTARTARPLGVAVDVTRGAAWVVDERNDSAWRIDVASKQLVSRVRVGDRPQSVAVGANAVWVVSWDGSVSRIDPDAKQELLPRIELGGHPTGVAVGAGAVWVTDRDRDRVWRIDPSALTPEPTIDYAASGPAAVAVGYDAVWVPNLGDRTVSRIDPRTNRVVRDIEIRGTPCGVAVGEAAVWVTTSNDDKVWRIDPERDTTVGDPVEVEDGPCALAVGEGAVWVGNRGDSSVSRFEP